MISIDDTILVAVDRSGGSVWTLGSRPHPTARSIPFGIEAVQSWTSAVAALGRSLPLLWEPFPVPAIPPNCAHQVGVQLRPGCVDSIEQLEGASFGLSFLLSAAARALSVPVPGDIVASATVLPEGTVGPVGGITEKVGTVLSKAPSVRRFLVARPDLEAARSAAGRDDLEIIPVDSAASAIDQVFGAAPAERFVERGADPARRSAAIRSLLLLAIGGRKLAFAWHPVAVAASLALARWESLDLAERRSLELVAMVARRHDGLTALDPSPMLDLDWMARLPDPLRMNALAHWVQQSADTGLPPAAMIEDVAVRSLPPIRASHVPHLRLRGALVRSRAARGAYDEALEGARETARAFLSILEPLETAPVLAEWARLCGVLGREHSLLEAEEVFDTIRADLDPASKSWLALAFARARVLLGNVRERDETVLRDLAADRMVAPHVRWSAARWLLRLLGRGQEGENVRAALHASAGREDPDGREAVVFLRLVGLDDALRAGDVAGAIAVAKEIRRAEPGPVDALLVGLDEDESARRLSIVYPY